MDVEDGVSVSGGTACQSVSQSVNGVWSTMDVEPVSAPSSPMSTEEAPSAEEMTSRAEPHLLGIDEAGRGCVTRAHPNQPLARRGSRAVPWWTLPRATPRCPFGPHSPAAKARGALRPVLGPMVYGTAWCPISRKEEMSKLGFMGARAAVVAPRAKALHVLGRCPGGRPPG